MANDPKAWLDDAAPGLDLPSPFLIAPVPGLTPVIGHLASMMAFARATTLRAVDGLTTAELDERLDDEANSIGALLEHMACLEEFYQEDTFGWTFEGEALERRQLGMGLGDAAREGIRGHDLQHYRRRLREVRGRTLAELARREDTWLFQTCEWWNGMRANHYFKWFHVAEDELNHRGQIRILRKRLRSSPKA